MAGLKTIAGDIAIGMVFFSRLPLPHFVVKDRTLGDAIWSAPIVGLAVALIAGGVYATGWWLGLAAGPAAALALAGAMLATGCLHEDGLSDTADGFGGGRTKERKLEIMHDSRVGTYGAAALLLAVLLRWSALAAIATPGSVFLALLVAHTASRAAMPLFMVALPQARNEGLSVTVGSVSEATAAIAAAIGLAALLLLGAEGLLVSVLVLSVLFLAFRRLCIAQIGGLTGDTIGAWQQIAEIALLLIASAILT
ncbi:adenosylcobinamide-GDP ribazoletransferase [Corticibacterium sp. UT-5YL-CI-8]|nr:adenosylcobinamide-GDP ribazoletransferase [Tianweitania sp. UT-5YL-CI-8]